MPVRSSRATGGSTNAALHIPALAHEAGIRFTLDDVATVFERTPLIGNLQPGGQYYAQDVDRIGGVPTIVKTLVEHGHLHGETLTVTGQTLAEIAAGASDQMDRLSGRLIAQLLGAVVSSCSRGISRRMAHLSKLLVSRHSCMKARRACSKARKTAWPSFVRAPTSRAMSSSFATKGPKADRVCARCWTHRGHLRPGHG